MGLVHAGITAGQLGNGDGHEDHEEAGGEVLVFGLTLQLVNRIFENKGQSVVSVETIILNQNDLRSYAVQYGKKEQKYCRI
jgi:hypothetical protein